MTLPERLVLAYFSRSVPVAVAERDGIFAAHGLAVETIPVDSSPHQFGLLRDGACDLALTSPDNVVAYRTSDRNPLGVQLDVRMLQGVDAGLGLAVMAAPGIEDLACLRGRVVGVDVPQSGFALALFGLLEGVGLHAGVDYEVRPLGSTPQRRQALLAGTCDATLLNAGHDIAAEVAGCRRLASVTDVYHPYLGAVLAASGPWLDAHLDLSGRFVDAWGDAVRATLDPARRRSTVAIIAGTLGLPDASADRFYEVLASRSDGLAVGRGVDPAALATVIGLRAGQGSAVPASDSGLIDDRFAGNRATGTP